MFPGLIVMDRPTYRPARREKGLTTSCGWCWARIIELAGTRRKAHGMGTLLYFFRALDRFAREVLMYKGSSWPSHNPPYSEACD